MYSLVSAPVLGFDLTRLHGGAAVADVLVRALTLTIDDLEILAAAHADDWDRLELWQEVDVAARKRGTAAAAVGTTDGMDLVGALTVLERTPLGTIDGLLHCLRHDVLDWTWRRHPSGGATGSAQSPSASRAAGVLCDALAAAYLRELLSDDTRRRLSAPWVAAVRQLPERTTDLGPQAAAVTRLIERVRTLGRPEIDKLTAAADQARPGIATWAASMHSATWSVFLSGRVRAAAVAQLDLVQAIDSAGIPVAGRAGGVWNLLSGAVQALVARDAVDARTVHRLLDPYLTALGTAAVD